MIKLCDPNDTTRDDINRLWNSLSAWTEQSSIVADYFRAEYTRYDNWNGGIYFLDIDYENEYKVYFGESYPLLSIANRGIQVDELKDYIEIMYERWIKPEKHYEFTIEMNKMFDKFHVPYKLSSGKIIGKGYRTTESVGMILNHRMFERKISYAEEMIMSKEMLDKKCALDYIVDALQYYISIQNEQSIDKKYGLAAKSVNTNKDGKIYAVVKNELNEVMKIANEYFDIRHNEYLNKSKEKREPLEDIQFIEYLYNRVYSLLYLLRLKVKHADIIETGSE